MALAAQFQDIIFKGGNAFFRSATQEWQAEPLDLPQESHHNSVERSIVKTDQFMNRILHVLMVFFTELWRKVFAKQERDDQHVTHSGRPYAYTYSRANSVSGRRLVEKFNTEYRSTYSSSPKRNGNTKKARRRRSVSDYLELVLGIPVYLVWKAWKGLKF